MVTKKLDAFGKKMDFGPKNCIFGPKFCIFLRYTYETPIFSAQTVKTQWDHKSPISWGNSGYLQFSGRWPFGRLAARFVAPIAQSGPFGVQKCCFWPETFFFGHPCKGVNRKMLSFWCPVMVVTNKVGQFPKKMGSWPKNCIFYPKFCVFLRYTYETPISLARTVPTQWDDNSSISWGNSGYPWFSGRRPLGHSAGLFRGPDCTKWPFWGPKMLLFWLETNFLWSASK